MVRNYYARDRRQALVGRLFERGDSIASICKQLKVSKPTVYRDLGCVKKRHAAPAAPAASVLTAHAASTSLTAHTATTAPSDGDNLADFSRNMLMESINADLARGATGTALLKAQYSGDQRIIKYVNVQMALKK